MSPLILPAAVAAVLLLLNKKTGTDTATTEPVDPNPEPTPEPGPQVQPQPPAGTPLPPLVRGGIFPVGTTIRAVNTPSGAFIHNAPNSLVSTRIGRIANGSVVSIPEAGPPSPDDQGGSNFWTKITAAGGLTGFIADSLLGPASIAGTAQRPAAPPTEATPGVSATTTDGDFVFVDPLGNTHNVPASGVVLVDPITGLLNAVAEPGNLLAGVAGHPNFAGLSAGAWARRPAFGQTRFAQPMVGASGYAAAVRAQTSARRQAAYAQQYPGSGTATSQAPVYAKIEHLGQNVSQFYEKSNVQHVQALARAHAAAQAAAQAARYPGSGTAVSAPPGTTGYVVQNLNLGVKGQFAPTPQQRLSLWSDYMRRHGF